MGEEKQNWFQKHRGFIFGFAVVVLILNILIFLLVPSQSAVAWEKTAAEYSLTDESPEQTHTLQLEGTLTTGVLTGSSFSGTLTLDGVSLRYSARRENGRWDGAFSDASGQTLAQARFGELCVSALNADKSFQTPVLLLAAGTDEVRFLVPGAKTRLAALQQIYQQFPEYS